MILVVENNFESNNSFSIERWDKAEREEYQIKQDDIASQNDFVFPVYSTPVQINLISKIRRCNKALGDYADAVWGVKIYQKGKGKPKQKGFESEEKIFHSDKKIKKSHKPLVGGSSVMRYRIDWKGGYIDYGEWLAEPRTPEWFGGLRILVREVTANGVIQAALTDEDYVFSNSVDGIRLKNNKLDELFLLGILNSQLISFYHLNTSANSFKGAFPKVLIKDLLNIPMPDASSDDQKTLVMLVGKMLGLHKQSPRTPQEKEHLAREISSTDREIDALVYELYGLTEEEVRIVEGGLK